MNSFPATVIGTASSLLTSVEEQLKVERSSGGTQILLEGGVESEGTEVLVCMNEKCQAVWMCLTTRDESMYALDESMVYSVSQMGKVGKLGRRVRQWSRLNGRRKSIAGPGERVN